MKCDICKIDLTNYFVKDEEKGKWYCIECFDEIADDIDKETKKEAN